MDYKNINDYELIYLIEENNDEAWDILFNKYYLLLMKFTNNFYKRFRKYGICFDDLFQESCLAFNKTVKLFNSQENVLFYTFLCINIKGVLINYIRKLKSNSNLINVKALSLDCTFLSDSAFSISDFIADNRINLEDSFEYNELLDKLNNFKWRLTSSYAQVFELLCNGFTCTEITKLLDINYKLLCDIVYRIRKKLKKHLAMYL